ncbi:MAG: DUF1015 domain-containing protein, partial [Candidatus Diapherotrites archaeon]|nr:DUF1015 domain-containing protein [Candidatus Diapherotrites archaeon]
SEEERQSLLAKSQYNFARLSLGNQGSEKNTAERNYEKAAALIGEWLEAGIFEREEKPAFYVYREDYELEGQKISRTGFFCLLRLEKFENGNVLPHEKTLPKPKADRLNLLEATKCDLEPIWLLFEERGWEASKVLESAAQESPEIDFVDEGKRRHRLWALKEESAVKQLQESMRCSRMFIADGHHRYETAMNFSEKEKTPESKYKMVYALSTKSPGLKILPTHRGIIKACPNFIERLSELFRIEEVSEQEMLKAVGIAGKTAFGLLFQGKFRILRPKPEAAALLQEKPAVLRELPTFALDSLVFQKALGTGLDNIAFEKSRERLVQRVKAGELEAAFFVQPTSISQFEQVSIQGQVMPQKSTFFYPKPLSGLVFYKLYG